MTSEKTTLEREWGRLRRGQLIAVVRAASTPALSPLAVELLRAVVRAGEIRSADLAGELLVTKTSISRYVKEMLDEGLLVKRPDPSDGRAMLLSASRAGRDELVLRESRRSAVLGELCQDWSADEVTTLTNLLQRLNDGLERRLRGS